MKIADRREVSSDRAFKKYFDTVRVGNEITVSSLHAHSCATLDGYYASGGENFKRMLRPRLDVANPIVVKVPSSSPGAVYYDMRRMYRTARDDVQWATTDICAETARVILTPPLFRPIFLDAEDYGGVGARDRAIGAYCKETHTLLAGNWLFGLPNQTHFVRGSLAALVMAKIMKISGRRQIPGSTYSPPVKPNGEPVRLMLGADPEFEMVHVGSCDVVYARDTMRDAGSGGRSYDRVSNCDGCNNERGSEDCSGCYYEYNEFDDCDDDDCDFEDGPIGVDGSSDQVELRPDPKYTGEALYREIRGLADEFAGRYPGYTLGLAGHRFPLGCHIHVGTDSPCSHTVQYDAHDVSMLDRVIGGRCLHLSGGARGGYGRLGEINWQNHGFEYRTPPSAILVSEDIAVPFLDAALAIAGGRRGYRYPRGFAAQMRRLAELVESRTQYTFDWKLLRGAVIIIDAGMSSFVRDMIASAGRALSDNQRAATAIRLFGFSSERGMVTTSPALAKAMGWGLEQYSAGGVRRTNGQLALNIAVPYEFRHSNNNTEAVQKFCAVLADISMGIAQ